MHLTVMQIFRIISANADRVIAWYLLGPIPTAIYTFAATPVIKAYQLLPIGAVSLPHLSTHEFTVETKRTVAKKSMLLFFITLPIVLCGIILAPFLYKLFFPHYPESVLYFQILIATLLFSPILLIDAALVAFHKTKTLYVTETVSPIVKIILMIIGGSISGLIGMTIGIFIATCFDFLLTLIMFYQTKTVQ